MTKEEKAKAYDEAMKRAKNLENTTTEEDALIKYIFPELTESDDERIIKALIQYLKDYPENLPNGLYSRRDFFTYLEKQKEQSIAANDLDEEIHRFFVDCIDVHESKLYGSISERVIPVGCYELTARHFAKWGEKQKEQKPAEESGTVEPDYGICDDYIPASLHHALKRHGWYATHVGEKPDKEVIKYVEATMEQKPTEKSSMLKKLKEHLANTTREQLDAEFEELKDLTIDKPAECSEDERIRKEINILYADIDACITALLKARMDKDSEAEGKALFKMEGLMVATLQVITCIEDYLEKQKEHGL